jgi:hypothetical protein
MVNYDYKTRNNSKNIAQQSLTDYIFRVPGFFVNAIIYTAVNPYNAINSRRVFIKNAYASDNFYGKLIPVLIGMAGISVVGNAIGKNKEEVIKNAKSALSGTAGVAASFVSSGGKDIVKAVGKVSGFVWDAGKYGTNVLKAYDDPIFINVRNLAKPINLVTYVTFIMNGNMDGSTEDQIFLKIMASGLLASYYYIRPITQSQPDPQRYLQAACHHP